MHKLHRMNHQNTAADTHPETSRELFFDKTIAMFENIAQPFDEQKKPEQKSDNINCDRIKIAASICSFVCLRLYKEGAARTYGGRKGSNTEGFF